MRKIQILVILSVLFVIGVVIAAQNPLLGARTITRLPAEGVNSDVDELRCGDYFLFQEDPPVVPRGPRIGFHTQEREGDPKDLDITLVFLQNKFKIFINDSLKTPTAELKFRVGPALLEASPGQTNFVLREKDVQEIDVQISRKDYERSRSCLPKPEKSA